MIITISQAGSEKIQYYIYTYKGKEGGREGGRDEDGGKEWLCGDRKTKKNNTW